MGARHLARLAGWLAADLQDTQEDPLLFVESVPIGETRDELVASKYRTREVIAELAAQLR